LAPYGFTGGERRDSVPSMTHGLDIRPLRGDALRSALPDLAALRIAVFAEWPYLYDGDAAYERDYMAAWADSPDALIVGAFDGERLVGAATAAPMEDHADDFAAPFRAAGRDLGDYLYCGESVLLPAWRGRGAGHAFFDHREAHGRALGRPMACFCAVIRDAEDPRRPAEYRPLDAFWRKRGYAPDPDLTARFDWREHGATEATAHAMRFWLKRL
jgi:GNAT superfamily N-acetyltransferase